MARTEKQIGEMSIEEEWKLYRKEVIHKDANEVQVKVMKSAFFAGAFVSQSMTIAIVDNYTEEVAEMILGKLHEDTKTELTKG